MWQVVHQFAGKARKRYNDDAAEEIRTWIYYGLHMPKGKKLCFADGRVLVRCKRDKEWLYSIQPCQLYVRQFNTDGGDTCTWRAKKELYDICVRYNLFSND